MTYMARTGREGRDKPNALFHGDNLDVLREYIEDSSVDLIYLDPPFQSGRDHNLPFKRADGTPPTAQIKAFTDTWTWDHAAKDAFDEVVATGSRVGLVLEVVDRVVGKSAMLSYMSMMALRLIELHRVLKPTGSLYLHCDPTASHYLKVVLDAVFGSENFINEIIWRRSRAHNDRKIRKFGAIHETLLYYGKSAERTFVPQYAERDKDAPKTHDLYRHTDGKLYRKDNCNAPGERGPRYEWNGHVRNWRFSPEERDRLIREGKIVYSKNGMPRVLRPVDPTRGSPLQDLWTDIDPPNSGSHESRSIGYPTQKPVELLERIVTASTNEGDVVLDPFCGCGTTIHAAHNLKRRWIGIDIAKQAIDIIRERFDRHFGEIARQTYTLVREPQDMDGAVALAEDDRYQFERWAVRLAGGEAGEKRKGADGGVDSVLTFQEAVGAPVRKIIVSVKSGHVGVRDVRDLRGTIEREKAAIGVLITLHSPTAPMRREAATTGFFQTTLSNTPEHFPKIQIITIDELFEGVAIRAPVTFRRKAPKRKNPQTEFAFTQTKQS